MSQSWTLAQIPSQANKRFFITGANSGVGYAAAVELARRGAVIVMACRDQSRGEKALRRLKVDASGPHSAANDAELVLLDLASLDSIRQVAEAEVERHLPLHGLINNAGVMGLPKRHETRDGFELTFGTNLLGHFALTSRLLPALEMAHGALREDSARVVTLASIAHKRGRLNFEDLQSKRKYSPIGVYTQSKLANLMFAFELERRLRTVGGGMDGKPTPNLSVVSIAVHPGVAKTNILKAGAGKGLGRITEKFKMAVVGLLLNSELDGALPTLYAATAAEAKGGGYYGPQGLFEMRGGDVGPAKVSVRARDEAAQRRLWEICEELTGCTI